MYNRKCSQYLWNKVHSVFIPVIWKSISNCTLNFNSQFIMHYCSWLCTKILCRILRYITCSKTKIVDWLVFAISTKNTFFYSRKTFTKFKTYHLYHLSLVCTHPHMCRPTFLSQNTNYRLKQIKISNETRDCFTTLCTVL